LVIFEWKRVISENKSNVTLFMEKKHLEFVSLA